MKAFAGRLLSVLLWASVVGAALLLGMRWVDTPVGMVTVLQSVVPVTGLVAAALTMTGALARRWRVTASAGVLLGACAMLAVPSVLSHAVAPARDDLVVMSANLEYGGADAKSLVTAVREHRADVLVLIEVTPAAVERLRVAGLDRLLPQSAGRSSGRAVDAGGTMVRSRFPMTLLESGHNHFSARAFDQPVVSIHGAAGDIVLRAIHLPPPDLAGAVEWRSGLSDLQAWREKQPPGRPIVLAGDFNSSWGHPGFRAVVETMTDAHRAAGQGWVRTWPQGRRLIRPFIQLDHVLVRGLGVVDANVVHLPRTDHAAVWARVSARG